MGIPIIAGLTVFFWLQAFYWMSRARRAKKVNAMVARLGTDSSLSEESLVRRGVDESGRFNKGLIQLLEEAGEEPNVSPFISKLLIACLVPFLFVIIIFNDLGASIIFGLMGLPIPYWLLKRKRRKRMERIEDQLPEALEVMTISLRAGQSLQQTIKYTASELEMPIREEFMRIAEEGDLGRSLEDSLLAMSARLNECRTIQTFVVSVLVLHQTGGNLIEVLEGIIETMRQQSRYIRKLGAMTAEGRSSARMLAFLPPLFVSFAFLANRSYVSILFEQPAGRVMLGLSMTLYAVGLFWTNRLTNPKV
ncbi:type II secretion system F family protein [Myxococcota bacterium]|nr:type II secretion system F family protein [Myxococcota bacterium]MBU1432939.1 type II secretion system F family protein [Myxococcota bacterium]MBU1896241.1 type II secretion system F family protein [Myxococcota bacterium]